MLNIQVAMDTLTDIFNKDIHILIVDDIPLMRKIVRGILRELGYSHVEEAEDGNIAFKKLKADKFDLVISDWNMPNVTGLDLLKMVKQEESLKAIPFLMLTAEAQKTNVIEAMRAGVSNYIIKPFTKATFQGKLEMVYKQQQALLQKKV